MVQSFPFQTEWIKTISNRPQASKVKVVPSNDCNKGDPDIVIEDASERSCDEFAEDGYRCAPFYACKGGEIIVNGAGLTNIRSTDSKPVSRQVALDPTVSKCNEALDICCRLPEWRDVPPDTFIEIPKVPEKFISEHCKEGLKI